MAIGVNWKEIWAPIWKPVWTTVPPVDSVALDIVELRSVVTMSIEAPSATAGTLCMRSIVHNFEGASRLGE